ncbi:hypothetical protein [Nocardia asteroides]|uniref:hypothetical protein n=1 Tax=Nocardia asteroides TaxID=1824 RepID=UPI001E392E0B|nr:hypothetical protein [Nocardia asteroides]UGT62451.1 hypothetical protein LTT61_03645 [Nocardia asteroides]
MTVAEPPRPQRGSTAAERGPDVSAAQQAVVDERSWAGRAAAAANPKFLLSQAEGYPVGIKQFLQFCLILVYPAWLFVLVLFWPLWAVGKLFEGILYVLFWPVRAMHRRNNPEEYAAFQAELAARKAAGGQR